MSIADLLKQHVVLTYAILGAALDVHPKTSKQMLYDYVSNNQHVTLHIVYCVSGIHKQTQNHVVKLVKNLDQIDAEFSQIYSKHIYSISEQVNMPSNLELNSVWCESKGPFKTISNKVVSSIDEKKVETKPILIKSDDDKVEKVEKRVEKVETKRNFFGKDKETIKTPTPVDKEIPKEIPLQTDYMDQEDDETPKSRISKQKAAVMTRSKQEKKTPTSPIKQDVMSDLSEQEDTPQEKTKVLKKKKRGEKEDKESQEKEGSASESEKKKKKVEDLNQNKLELVKTEKKIQMVKKKIKTKDERGYTVYTEIEVEEQVDMPVKTESQTSVKSEIAPPVKEHVAKKMEKPKPAGQSSLLSFFKK